MPNEHILHEKVTLVWEGSKTILNVPQVSSNIVEMEIQLC